VNASVHFPSFPARIAAAAGLVVISGITFATCLAAQTITLSPAVTQFSSRLPVLVIDNAGSGALLKGAPDQAAELAVFKPDADLTRLTGQSPALSTALTISVRGASSADFPKKSFNLTLRDRRGNKQAQALLDLPAGDKWALVAPWKFDLSYLNNAFVYALSNRMGRWAPRTRFVEVFINPRGGDVTMADYAGIYVLTERVEPAEQRVNVAKLSAADKTAPAITGGYILKIDQPATDDVAWKTARTLSSDDRSAVVLVAPRAEDVTSAQYGYIREYVLAMEKALRADQAGGWTQRTSLDFVDRPSWVDRHLLNTFLCNPDAFVRSAYFTKDRGGRMVAGPVWDFDRAMGSYWDERSFRWDVWSGVGAADVWRTGWWGLIAQDSEFMQAWIDRWQSLRDGDLATARLTQLAGSLANEIGADAAARDAARWPDNASPRGSFALEIARVTGWLALRAGWIDEQSVARPARAIGGGIMTFTAPRGALLAYTIDGTDPRSVGGEVAPNATLTAEPLVVAADANVHVRSYRADTPAALPGSPWSSAMGGEQAAPLQPRARFTNFSSRAVIGSGEHALIAGFVVADTSAKRFLARAMGPGLVAFGVEGYLPRPLLSLAGTDGVEQSRNAGWESSPAVSELPMLAKSVGAFPFAAGKPDAAVVNALGAGAHSLTTTALEGGAGIGLVELYELDGNGRTSNFATRAMVKRGGGGLIAGFVVQGPASQRVLIRGVGPTLTKMGLANALQNPTLTIQQGTIVVATNDRWSTNDTALARATKSVGTFPLESGSEDTAIFVTLVPGAYVVEINGHGDSEGVVLLEVYEVP
jgi:hypothetical protein